MSSMEQSVAQLLDRINQLEKENQALKNLKMTDVFSFDFLFDAVKQPAFILKADRLDNIPKIEKVNISGVELLKRSRQEIESLSPIDIGLFSSMDQNNPISIGERLSISCRERFNNSTPLIFTFSILGMLSSLSAFKIKAGCLTASKRKSKLKTSVIFKFFNAWFSFSNWLIRSNNCATDCSILDIQV